MINRKSFIETINADNQREALEIADLMYPLADYIELAWYAILTIKIKLLKKNYSTF